MRLRATRTFVVEPSIPHELAALKRLASNLYWTWNTDAVALFERIDRDLWELTGHNPVALLQRVAPERWHTLAEDEGFADHLRRIDEALTAYLERPPLLRVDGADERQPIAYFSLEFALSESLPNYSGGLGVLAGDHLRSASDLGLPLVGVGLLYHEGYFQQHLGADGWQHEDYVTMDLAAQPLQPVRSTNGDLLTIEVPIDGRNVVVRIWRLDVGKVPLFLLDTRLDANTEADHALSGRLYGGDNDLRVRQEIVLGVGGVRALHAMGLVPAVCHMNEGHSSLLGLERIRMLMEANGVSFEEARLPVSGATAFTTHTAVAAGIDLFPPELVMRYLGEYAAGMGLDAKGLLGLGRTNPEDAAEPFSMAMLGLRLSGFRNGVSKLHQSVSQKLWEADWPLVPVERIPIDAVTNGVHLPAWVGHEMADVFDRYIGPGWRDDPVGADWARVHHVPDDELWHVHERQRERLITRARSQQAKAFMRRGLSPTTSGSGRALDPRTLTIAFARRFAGYKRATLLFRDPARLAAILNNADRPVQFIFAGKAHPKDEPAKALIRDVVEFSARPEFRDRLVLLEGYDVELARVLVQGADVWLNNPLRPLEASGTSGMKACANGAIHMSVMDGWWWEAYKPGLGWAIGRQHTEDDPEAQDAFDVESIYNLLENEVTTAFYGRDADGIPVDWVRRMKASIAAFSPVFNTSRMVGEYAAKAYSPAANRWDHLRSNSLAPARALAAWLERVRAGWQEVTLGEVSVSPIPGGQSITVRLHPGRLLPGDLMVRAYFGPTSADTFVQAENVAALPFISQAEDGTCLFGGELRPSAGGRTGYNVCILPCHPDLHDPYAPQLAHWA